MWEKAHAGTATMTLASLICSSLLLGAVAWSSASATVSGRVELVDSKDRARKKRPDYSGVVIWLEPRAEAPLESVGEPGTATMRQKNKRFIPHVLAVRVGTAVDFPNQDPIFHNAFSSFDGQIFDIGLYPPGTSRRVVFQRPGVVRVFCNIHSMMSAVIAVVPTPWFATSSAKGTFEISGVPAGEYRLKVFHERALPETLAALERKVVVGAEGLSLGVIRISESGYISVPHKNKHGKEYPPLSDDHPVYSGGRR